MSIGKLTDSAKPVHARARKHHTPEELAAFKQAIEQHVPIQEALVKHLRYSPTSAARGKACIPKSVQAQLIQDGLRDFAKLGKAIDASTQEDYVRGKALASSLEGSDKGFNMLKLLAQDKRVDMLRPDSVTGVIFIEAPRIELPDPDSVPRLDASNRVIDASELSQLETSTARRQQ